MKRIAIMPGGGVMGMISLACWDVVEDRMGAPLHERFDLMVGTSVGAITAAAVGSGKMSASGMLQMCRVVIPEAFKRRRTFYPKYDRLAITEAFNQRIGIGFRMQECPVKVIITAVRARDKTNHFFKSWQKKDGHLSLVEVLTRSYAAPMYFGKWRTPGTKEVWLDGGTGSQNTPIVAGIWEAMRQGWLGRERVHVLSVGTGFSPEVTKWDKLRRMRWLREISMYMDPADGGMARYQSRNDNIKAANDLLGRVDGFTFQHVDVKLSRRENRIDGVKYMDLYESYGRVMGSQVDYGMLQI